MFIETYADVYSHARFVRCLSKVDYDKLRAESERYLRRSQDVAHAAGIANAYNRSGGKGTVNTLQLTLLD